MRKLLVVLVVLAVLAAGVYLAVSRALASDLVRATLEQQLSAWLGQPVRIGGASAAIFPRVAIDLHDVAIGEPAGLTVGRVRMVTGLRPLLSRTIEDAEVILNDGELRLPLAFDLLPAAPSTATAPAESPLKVASIRVIEIRRLVLVSGDQRWVTDADCTIAGERLEVARLSAEAKTTRLHGSGALTISRTDGEFTVAANPLDLDELLAFGPALTRPPVAPSPGAAAAPASPMRVKVTLTAPAGRFAEYQFRDLSTTALIAAGALSMSPLAVSAFGGRLEGRLDADTRKAVPVLRFKGRVEDLDVVEVMKAAGSSGGITGRLGGTLSLSAAGSDSATLLRTARGSIGAAITNGTVPGLELVRPIVLAFGKPSGAPPQGSGSTFSRLGGTFALADGVITSSDISMTSRDFDVNGTGRVMLGSGALSARGEVRLSSELTAQSGVDLRRYAQEDGRVVVPVTIGGTLQQPNVTLDLAAATRRALTNELQRRTKSLIDDLFGRRKK